MSGLPLIVFDVNETLLDLQTMAPLFQQLFGEKSAMRLWFDDLILYSAALTVAGCYVPVHRHRFGCHENARGY